MELIEDVEVEYNILKDALYLSPNVDRDQISKDLDRTYNDHWYFSQNKAKTMLEEFLMILSLKYSNIGYV